MKEFVRNLYGGLDVMENDQFLLHLSEDDLKAIYKIQKKNFDMGDIRDRISDWVMEQLEEDDYSFEDFNSSVFSGDEISEREICQKILGNDALIESIADALNILENQGYSSSQGFHWWESLNTAIEQNVSIKDIMGEILHDKHHKELEVGRWRVAVLEKGDAYGLNGKLIYDKAEPAVEFYDADGGNVFVSRYSIESLMTTDWSGLSIDDLVKQGVGLCLYGDVREWTVQPAELNVIGAWLRAVRLHSQEKTQDCVESLISDARSRTVDAPVRDAEKEFGFD